MTDALYDDLIKEVRRRSDNFENFFRAGDAAGLVADYYVEDPLLSAPDVPLLTSRAAITEMFAGLMQGFSECRLIQHDVRMSGDRGYELGKAVITSKDPGQLPADCRYVIVWRKTDDGWRVETDFFAFGKLV